MSQIALWSVVGFAGDWDKKTKLTVNEEFQVPGHVLQPGKYVMFLVDSPGNRHVVRIMNEREDRVVATMLAIPNYRLKPTPNTQFQWWETPRGTPTALRAWFFPGDNFGQEFAYPKGISTRIAREVHFPVPTSPATTEAEMKTADVSVVEPTGEEHALPLSTYRREEPVQLAQLTPGQAPASATPTPAERAPALLPTTASPIFTVGLFGALAVALGVALRFAVRAPQR
jgi:hypothetical protein